MSVKMRQKCVHVCVHASCRSYVPFFTKGKEISIWIYNTENNGYSEHNYNKFMLTVKLFSFPVVLKHINELDRYNKLHLYKKANVRPQHSPRVQACFTIYK